MARIPAERRRETFVAATIEAIAEHGVSGATTREIAQAAGAPLASLHYCFDSKEELFFATLDHLAGALADRVEAGAPAAGLGPAAAQVLRDVATWCLANRPASLAYVELTSWAQRQPGGVEAASAAQSTFQRRTADALVGSCGPGQDAELTLTAAQLLSMLLEGRMLQWFAFTDEAAQRADIDATAELLTGYFGRRSLSAGGRR